jgi:ABC-type lipoprotein export system ATPase subunit
MSPRLTEATVPPAAASASTAIACRGLVRIYAAKGIEVQALQGLDLDIASGELVAIVGASGSGKSTLLGILSAHDRPTAGTAVVAGMPVQALTRAQRLHYRRRVVGFVWQHTERNLVPYLSIADNLSLARSLGSGRDAREPGGTVGDLVELMGIGDVMDRLPGEISGGQRQRAAIAVGLVNGPEVLLADEPTGELDDATSAEVLEIMRRVIHELGTTSLIVTHDATVSELVGRTIQLRDGRISSEVFREAHDIASGSGVHREFTVVDSVGRMQLPKEYMAALQIRDRARLELLEDHVGVYPQTPRPSAAPSAEGEQQMEPEPRNEPEENEDA